MTTALTKDVYIVKEGCPVQGGQEDLRERYRVSIRGFATAGDCLEILRRRPCSLLVVGLDGVPDTGLQLLTQSSQMYPLMLSIAVVSEGDVHAAVAAMRAGAHECMEQPAGGEWWLGAVEKAAAEWRTQHPHSNGILTETEKFVLAQVVAGRTSKEIAFALHRSPRTVEVHRTHIMQKLGVSGTVDLVRHAVVMELVDSPPSP